MHRIYTLFESNFPPVAKFLTVAALSGSRNVSILDHLDGLASHAKGALAEHPFLLFFVFYCKHRGGIGAGGELPLLPRGEPPDGAFDLDRVESL